MRNIYIYIYMFGVGNINIRLLTKNRRICHTKLTLLPKVNVTIYNNPKRCQILTIVSCI